ncbi:MULTISPECIES: GAF domain-containing protein [Marinobacter]|uniref:GAF domain-containing protein n=1 Tax=Marinobacter metalliresistant TaxID=2961995 RepID=A0ABZ2VYX1_9GAMM|nr:GAF domain-containing protein [Marinobacter sp. Arc7-DN-1]AXS84005.1 diguanylate cyclase [Marinobacter sp. Arc7-DN-1]
MAQILVLLGHSGNKRLLSQILENHELLGPQNGLIPDRNFDMVIADLGALVKWRDTLAAHREAQAPALIPVLLVVRESQLSRARSTLDGQFEDVVVSPLRAPELIARIANMLRLRQSTVELSQRANESESALENMDRAFRIFSACNELVIRAKTETELLDEMLGQLVGDHGYRFAWFGIAQHDEQKSVEVIAHCGGAAEYLENMQLSWGDNAQGQGPAGSAIRRCQPEVSQNLHTDPLFDPWRGSAAQHGMNSVLALPLLISENTVGVLALYSEKPNAFGESEIELMWRLAKNIALGLSALRSHQALDAEKERAEERAYRDALTKLPNRQWVLEELGSLEAKSEREQAHAAVLFIDLDGFKRVNDGLGHEAGDCFAGHRKMAPC